MTPPKRRAFLTNRNPVVKSKHVLKFLYKIRKRNRFSNHHNAFLLGLWYGIKIADVSQKRDKALEVPRTTQHIDDALRVQDKPEENKQSYTHPVPLVRDDNASSRPAVGSRQLGCGPDCARVLPLSSSNNRDNVLPDSDNNEVKIFEFKDAAGNIHFEELACIRNHQKLEPRHWYSLNCFVFSMDMRKVKMPVTMMDSMAGGSLMGRKLAKSLGWPSLPCQKYKYKAERYVLLNNTSLPVVGTFEVLVRIDSSNRFFWIEVDVVNDGALPGQWELLLSQRACTEAELLVRGPSVHAACACVQGRRTRYLTKPIQSNSSVS